MPLWFWPLAILWTVPLLLVVAMAVAVTREVLKDRRIARAEVDAERRALALIVRNAAAGSEPRPFAEGSFDAQRFNPRVHGRPDRWRT